MSQEPEGARHVMPQEPEGAQSQDKDYVPVGGKFVLRSDPYVPREDLPAGVGRVKEQKLITAAWMAGRSSIPMAPLLVGAPGVGKNRLIYDLAKERRQELYILQGHEDVTAEELACSVRFSDSNRSKMDYIISPLLTAMIRGGICFIDEIGKMRPRALALLVSVLDERRYIESSLLAAKVVAEDRFRFVAATNTNEVNALPEFIKSRMRPVIEIGYPDRDELGEIVAGRFPGFEKDRLGVLLKKCWVLWAKRSEEKDGKSDPTPRDLIQLFSLATSMADSDGGHANNSGPPDVTPEHLENAFVALFEART